MKTIVLTGGGTGGHIIPNISLLPHLKKHFQKIFYIGTNGMEKELISRQSGVTFIEIPAHKLNRANRIKNLALPFQLMKSICSCKKILKKIKPDVIFSKGGYVSVPVCIAGKMLKIPIVSHESDMTLGRANKLIYSISKKFCTSFDITCVGLKKAVFTGSPIRAQLQNGDKEKGYELSKVDGTRPTILVTGGSAGASDLNDIIQKILPKLLKKYNVIHLTGKNKMNKKIAYENYCQMEFCQNIEHLFKVCDVVISRAGSNAIYELLFLKKPMLLIPLPKGISRGDQVENAKYFEKKNFATVLEQSNMTEKTLMDSIENLFEKRKEIAKTQSSSNQEFFNGAENICNVILSVLKNEKK
ncbi:MAG: undecaprenyldiphospho-muramoylpentapeptide beta-N-acetylglucosaminyltransferase [Clostridia bacterium]|nr:undecaprenyldiphospho-muramoylpentapeptide beta-N-acetylglucosaminyltransferase [Clostridia bacterium]